MGVITSLDESDQEQPTEYKTFFYLSDGLIYSKWCFRFKSSFMCDLSWLGVSVAYLLAGHFFYESWIFPHPDLQ
jgi:hypothetical protein